MTKPLARLALLSLCLGGVLQAQTTVYSNVVGYDKIPIPANSDTIICASMHECPEFTGEIETASTSGGDAILTPTATTAWTVDEFAVGPVSPAQPSHFVRITGGALKGHYFDVKSNDETTVTIDLNGMPNTLVAGDTFKIVPFSTLDTLLPPATQTTLTVSLGTEILNRRSQLIFPNVGDGINLAPPVTNIFYIYDDATNGLQWTQNSTDLPAGKTPVRPDSYFIIRQMDASLTPASSFIVTGDVDYSTHTVPLATLSGAKQDNPIALGRPVPVRIDQLGFDGTNFVDSLGHLIFQRRDQLLVRDNGVVGVNKRPSRIYYRVAGVWYENATGGTAPKDADTVDSSTGLVVRKYNGTGASVMVENQPSY